MKILGIVGSFRKGSYNRSVFNFYQKMIQGQAEMVEGRFVDVPLYNEDLHTQGIPESVTRLAQQVREADAVLFFSPEYNRSIPGTVKNMLDWLSKVPDLPTAGKRTSIISASPGALGGGRMQYHLRQVMIPLDMYCMNNPEAMIGEVHKKVSAEGELTDEGTQKFMKLHFEKFKKFVSND